MDSLLEKVIAETADQEIEAIARGIANLDLTPEEMEANLIDSGYFVIESKYDNQI